MLLKLIVSFNFINTDLDETYLTTIHSQCKVNDVHLNWWSIRNLPKAKLQLPLYNPYIQHML